VSAIGELSVVESAAMMSWSSTTSSSSSSSLLLPVYLLSVFLDADTSQFHTDSQLKPEVETLHYSMSEHAHNGSLVADLMTDARLRQLLPPDVVHQLYFRFLSSLPVGAPMSIDRKSGMVHTAGDIDREAVKQCRHVEPCRLPVDVAIGPASYFRIIRVSVEIVDVNDNAPYFRQSTAVVLVRESASTGSSYALPVALDADGPRYGIQRYELTSSTSKLALLVESRETDSRLVPRLTVTDVLDREMEAEYQLKLTVYDGGGVSASVDITVVVLDSNDHSPQFDSQRYEVDVLESVPVGSVIVQVQVCQSALLIHHSHVQKILSIIYPSLARCISNSFHCFTFGLFIMSLSRHGGGINN